MASWTRLHAPAFLLLAVAAAPRLLAQEPSGPPPPSSGKTGRGPEVHELLPDLGRIGSQVGFRGGFSWNPYGVGPGFELGGYVDLPLARVPGGKLSYEILISLSDGQSDPFTITDPIAYIANLASGASRAAALAGPPQAPFPVVRSVRTSLRLLDVSPFALKYTILKLDHLRLRPYFVAGLDIVVVITNQVPEGDESLEFTGTAPFDDPLIAGLVAQAEQLTAQGVPTGQGNIEFGAHAGAGIEIRVSRGISLNLSYLFTGIGGTRQHLQSVDAAIGFHW